jgi:branched-chain amino acid transport system ATP-binding protein
MTAAAVLSVRDLHVRYGLARALSGVDLELAEGSCLAVLGANGAGKTTLAKAISGLVRPTSGSIRLRDEETIGWPTHRTARAGVAHLPAGRLILPGLTVRDNLRMAVLHACPRAERAAAIHRALGFFPKLGERLGQLAGTLSGGEQQMLSLARILAVPPTLLLADELSHGLAPIIVEQVFDALRSARDQGVTMIVVEQFVGASLDLADHAVLLRRGEVAWSGPAGSAAERLADHYLE